MTRALMGLIALAVAFYLTGSWCFYLGQSHALREQDADALRRLRYGSGR